MNKVRIAIFASGTGTNAINLIRYFKENEQIEVGFVLSNKSDAPVLNSASDLGIKALNFSNQEVADGDFLTKICRDNKTDWIVLAGYLRLIPASFIHAFDGRIINLHPALLPKYGGKGMHGSHVHKAVIENKETTSGITIHFVNEEFDKGEIIAQFSCPVAPSHSAEDLAAKIHRLEQDHLPAVIEKTILNNTL
jgi:phosphoribosylglycinamide formyltransferase-1